MVRHRVAVLIANVFAVLALGLALPVAGAQAAETGAVSAITWGQSRADVDREIALLKRLGAHYVRTNVNWAGLEPDGKGKLAGLDMYDYAVEQARAAGLEIIMPLSDGVPYWASGDPRKRVDGSGKRHWNRTYPPANMGDYAEAFRTVVERYAPGGVHIYEVWNEPNLERFWASGPDAAQYARMLRATYPVIKQADPRSTVLLGGLSRNDFSYLEDVYRAGGGGNFDAVAVHPYTYGMDPTVTWKGTNPGEDRDRLSWNSFPAIKEIRRSMDAFGDDGKGVWITEFGYSTTSDDGGVSEARQAELLTKAYKYVDQFPWVKAMLWYSARNTPWMHDANDYESRFGLATSDFKLKPSAKAFRAVSGGSTARESGPSAAKRKPAPRRRGRSATRRPSVRATAARTLVRGKLPAAIARRGHARLELQRHTGRAWVASASRDTRVRGGAYSATLEPRAGRWRVRIVVTRGGTRVWASAYREFRVGRTPLAGR
jgi:hypothetical protein